MISLIYMKTPNLFHHIVFQQHHVRGRQLAAGEGEREAVREHHGFKLLQYFLREIFLQRSLQKTPLLQLKVTRF